jgi:hypothetical protein
LREFDDQPIVLLDLECHLRNLLEHRSQRACESWRHSGKAAFGKTPRRGSRHTVAAGLGQSAYRVHCRGAEPNRESASSDQRECFLLFDGAVRDGAQDLRIQAGEAGELLRIGVIARP